jgi:hypothetical protein
MESVDSRFSTNIERYSYVVLPSQTQNRS